MKPYHPIKNSAVISSPVGNLYLESDGEFLTALEFTNASENFDNADEILRLCQKELSEYFSGTLKNFSVPVKHLGTEFQVTVYAALMEIPYGETTTYKALAEKINRPRACRAVGQANHNNNVSIIVPCHRVVGAGGKLVGYGGGVERKEWLINHERIHSS